MGGEQGGDLPGLRRNDRRLFLFLRQEGQVLILCFRGLRLVHRLGFFLCGGQGLLRLDLVRRVLRLELDRLGGHGQDGQGQAEGQPQSRQSSP